MPVKLTLWSFQPRMMPFPTSVSAWIISWPWKLSHEALFLECSLPLLSAGYSFLIILFGHTLWNLPEQVVKSPSLTAFKTAVCKYLLQPGSICFIWYGPSLFTYFSPLCFCLLFFFLSFFFFFSFYSIINPCNLVLDHYWACPVYLAYYCCKMK